MLEKKIFPSSFNPNRQRLSVSCSQTLGRWWKLDRLIRLSVLSVIRWVARVFGNPGLPGWGSEGPWLGAKFTLLWGWVSIAEPWLCTSSAVEAVSSSGPSRHISPLTCHSELLLRTLTGPIGSPWSNIYSVDLRCFLCLFLLLFTSSSFCVPQEAKGDFTR